MTRGALDLVVSEFRKVLDLPDPSQIYVMLGTIAANRLPKEAPVWLIIVGPPSSGKSEPLKYFHGLPDIWLASEISAAGLLSCSPRKEKKANSTGGLLNSIGPYGMLLISDMSPTLSMGPEQLAKFLSIMRDVYDGHVSRYGGQDGGMTVKWTGKVGLIAAATGEIDRHHSVINALGDRYMYFRMPKTDIDTKLNMSDAEPVDKKPVSEAISALLEAVTPANRPSLDQASLLVLKSLSKFVAVTRTAVIRDGISREVEHLNDPEEPIRLYKSLKNLFTGMLMVGVTAEEATSLISRVALDSLPPARLAVLKPIVNNEGPVAGKDIMAVPGTFSETTLRRAIEDLTLYRVITKTGVNGHPSTFSKAPWLEKRLESMPSAGFSDLSLSSLEKEEEKGVLVTDKSEKLAGGQVPDAISG